MEEIWKDIPGYEGLYEVSNLSRIKSVDRYKKGKSNTVVFWKGRILIPSIGSRGYPKVGLSKLAKTKQTSVHRIIAEVFIPNPENKPQINHINGIKSDNRIENLEWVTPSENIQHAFNTGLKETSDLCKRKAGERSVVRESIPIIDTKTGMIFPSIKSAAEFIGLKPYYVSNMLRNAKYGGKSTRRYKNTTSLTYATKKPLRKRQP